MAPPPPAEGRAEELQLPAQYADLKNTQIKIENVPANASGVTPIQLVTLYRPGKYNAFNGFMMEEIVRAWKLFDVDDRVKAIVVTGDGKMFCAGADLEGNGAFKRRAGANDNDHRDGGGRCTMAIHRCRKPTIGALNGSAVGIGITMTLPMTIRIAYKDAKIGFVFARRGLVMEAASSYFLPRLIGMSKTMHIITTGATYPANHKLLDGLFSETLDQPEQVLPRALEIAQDFVNNCSTVAFGLMHDLLWHQEDSPEKQHLLDSRILYSLYDSADIKEGVAAFLEKRPVQFKGTLNNSRPPNYPWWGPVDINPRTQGKL